MVYDKVTLALVDFKFCLLHAHDIEGYHGSWFCALRTFSALHHSGKSVLIGLVNLFRILPTLWETPQNTLAYSLGIPSLNSMQCVLS